MSELLIYSVLMVIAVFGSSISQIMLKISAKKQYESKLKEYLNPLVISAYVLFFLCTFFAMYTLKVIPLSLGTILEASGYIFVTFLSYMFLHEKLNRQKLCGLCAILVGVLIYSS